MTTHMPHPADHAPGYRAVRFNADWITRPLFGIVLAVAVVAAIFGGTGYIAAFAALVGVGAAREWHRMVGERVFGPAFILSSLVIVAALAAEAMWPKGSIGWAILGGGAVVVAAYAAFAKLLPAWHGAGPVYIATALLAVVMLREAPHGAVVIVGMFLAVWATDTAALIIGNLVGGPRLWPALSPNKTWSGTLGAIAVAALVEAGYVAVIGGRAVDAALYGAGIAVLAHTGDLAESWVKRIFQRKDSGGMIPGHGGVLDRIDSTLVVAPVVAGLVLFAGFNPLFGVHS
ncbi:MAG TPA: phosphatidate cytidylyltransferase [Rhizomicrobium sp.]|nr:phosphatidate cytidylyltransferase [Rhizomicrobium sp.]